MSDYVARAMETKVCGIPAKAWLQFFQKNADANM